MKAIAIITVLLICCTAIEDLSHPLECYFIELAVSTTSGDILSTQASHSFVCETEAIEKWKADEGIKTVRDTLTHTAVITIRTCIEPDYKGR